MAIRSKAFCMVNNVLESGKKSGTHKTSEVRIIGTTLLSYFSSYYLHILVEELEDGDQGQWK